MKKDLAVIAHEVFPDIVKSEYEELLKLYHADFESPDINPKISLDEAVSKYAENVLTVIENKENWKEDRVNDGIFIAFYGFAETFKEFFPVYYAENGYPYMDIGPKNYANGKKVIELLISKIFYQNYEGMEIRTMYFWRDRPSSPEYIRIYLRFSENKGEIYPAR